MSLRVLVLDDEPIVGRRLRDALAPLGCTVEIFTEPGSALSRFAQAPFDVVISDVLMDDLDGLEVLRRVRAVSPRTQVILITGYAMMEMAREAMEEGALEFIAKPFRPAEVRSVVRRAAAALGTPLPEDPLEGAP
jgi:DNA-binding NtrC family response regulator